MTAKLVLLAAVFAGAYGRLMRPRLLRWGSTPDEQTRTLPGDEFAPHASYETTRAVTIRAPGEAVWPWLVQMGQDRAGFYTHNWVERLLQSGIQDGHALHPEWQHLAVGDLVRTNRDVRGTPVGWPVISIDPGRSIVLQSRNMPFGTYSFAVEPIDGRTSRLIVRDRAAWKWWEWPFTVLVYEPLHAYMETGLLLGVRERAEASATSSGLAA